MDSTWASRLVVICDVKGQACSLKDSLTHGTQCGGRFPSVFKEKYMERE